MKTLIDFITRLLGCPVVVFGGLIAVSAFSLIAALIAEVVFGLEPCILCVYQRGPFVAGILLGIIGLFFWRKNTRATNAILLLCALNFLINSAIAFYHSGVELKWWRSIVEGCAVPSLEENPQSILENILSAPSARCDEIPWADPILGLSMANYNVLLCFGLFIVCAWSFALLRQRQTHSE